MRLHYGAASCYVSGGATFHSDSSHHPAHDPPMTLAALWVRGPYRGPTGYQRHTRAFVRELHRQGVAVQLVDVPEWSPATLPPGSLDPWFDSLAAPVAASVALQFCMPHQVVPTPGR